MKNGRIIEEDCSKYSDISKKLLDELYKISYDFREKIIDWCSKDEKLYFLEYWNLVGNLNKTIQGIITPIRSEKYDILVLPNTHIDFYPIAMKSRGVIVRMGGYLSHLANNCREKGISFIVSDEEYQEGEFVFLDERGKKVIRLVDIKDPDFSLGTI